MRQPDFSSPVDIEAYFYNNFGACGCSELETMINVVRDLLSWATSTKERKSYDTLFDNPGVFYLLAGRLDSLELIEHGTSIRHPWITDKGALLLRALQTITPEQIENHPEAEAYDGAWY